MKYVEAFSALGYRVPNPREDRSAEKIDRACVTLWLREVEWAPAPPRLDLWESAVPGTADWETCPGHKKRTRHMARAVKEFDGRLDVIILAGRHDEGYSDADPWLPSQRASHRWRIKKFDEATGYFLIAAERQTQETA